MSRFTVSEGVDETEAAIPAIIATATTPRITPFFFIIEENGIG